MRRIWGRGLSSGTSPERKAPESVTPVLSGFVHRNISRWLFECGTRSSLALADKRRFIGEILNAGARSESNQKPIRVNRIQCSLPLSFTQTLVVPDKRALASA